MESSDDQNDITGLYDGSNQQNNGLSHDFDLSSDSNVIESEVEGQINAKSVDFEQFDPKFENNKEIFVPDAEELVVLEPLLVDPRAQKI